MNKEEILSAYQYRHACKEFDAERTIPEEDVAFILETARLSPSSFGFEPWSFIVLQNQDIRSKLLPITWGAQKQLPTASHYVVLLARTKAGMLPESDYIQSIMKETQKLPPEVVERKGSIYRNFLENDFKIMGNERAMFEWSCRQAYIALGNMMTSAAMIGIDSCPVEGFDKDGAEHILREAGAMEGDEFGIACMVAFGYRKNEPRPKTRQSMERLVRWVR